MVIALRELNRYREAEPSAGGGGLAASQPPAGVGAGAS
jgi:hypothetical protein